MQRTHMHKPGWMHLHKPDWHTMGLRLDHLIHDPRFWCGLALLVLFVLMIVTAILTEPIAPTTLPSHPSPIYPYLP